MSEEHDEQDEQDEMARLRAGMDQAREGGKDFAGVLWGFYEGCLNEGFSDTQAMALTITYMQCVMGSWSS